MVDPFRAVRWTHNDRKTNDNTRGREIATCAAVRVEIQTCIHGGGSTSGFQALSGEWRAIFFFYEIAGRSRSEPVGNQGDAALLDPRSKMQGGGGESSKSREIIQPVLHCYK